MRQIDAADAQQLDSRKRLLDEWVSAQLGEPLSGQPASTDASFRRYFRYRPTRYRTASVVAMDAPPEREDSRPFVAIAELLRPAVHVPEILAQDLQRGFLLLSDLGTITYLQALTELAPGSQVQGSQAQSSQVQASQVQISRARALYADASAALIRLQQLRCPEELPRYDAALLQRELDLFPVWYVQRHLGRDWNAGLQGHWQALCDELLQRALAQSRVLVHRDYMPRNLMVCPDNPGILDFQDAVLGPVSYDPVCLFEDAFLSWPRPFVETGLQEYWRSAAAAGLPVPSSWPQFAMDCDLMAVQRHLKVIGIFARICHRDGKPHYLGDVPRFFGYLRGAVARQPEVLAPLRELLRLLGEHE